jgi:peptide-methionine (S)-S-oxide reductase
MNEQKPYELATLGGGCFWCLEPIYKNLKGVIEVVVGYAGGDVANPTYEMVCDGRTNHAEVVQIKFDSQVITFQELLEVFFSTHDPTTLNRQGADRGTQYRSIILYHDENQKEVAKLVITELNGPDNFDNKIVTQLIPYEEFYKAESYHQAYFEKNPYAGYCQVVINPKLKKFEKKYADRLKTG